MSDLAPSPVDRQRLFRIITPLLLFFGVEAWLNLFHGFYGLTFQWKALGVALLASLVPPIHRGFAAAWQFLRTLSPRTVYNLAIVIGLLATCYYPETGWLQGRNFLPKWQDELSYRIQFQQLAHGRLWYPQHACADFFDTFQMLVRPVYASIYFPGPSLLYAPALRAHLPLWMMSSLIAGAATGLIFLIFSELLDPAAALVAVVMLLGNSLFRRLSLMTFGYPIIVLLCTTALYAWLRWRRKPGIGWAILIGIALGWASISRPLDAIIISIPIALDVALHFWRRDERVHRKQIIAAILAASPFVLLQVGFDLGVTGKPLLTPFVLYADRDYPDTTFGFHTFDPSHRPQSTLLQKQVFHDSWTVPTLQKHTPMNVIRDWFPTGMKDVLDNLLPDRFLLLLVPLGVTGLYTRRRVLLAMILPTYIVLYSFYAFHLPQYAMITWPAVTLLVLLAVERMTSTWRRPANFLQMFLICAVIILSLTQTAEFNRYIRDEAFDPPGIGTVNTTLAELSHKPAVVLFHFPPDGNPHEEPVYNIDVPWPDDAPVIRAHDLGPRNIEIFRYYAEHQPERAFYRFDREDNSLKFLGYARELGRKPE